MKSARIFTAYFAQFLKSRMAYRADFFIGIVANMIVAASGLLFVVLLLDGKTIPSLQGWTRDEVLFIYGYSMFAMALFSTVAINLYQFGDRYVIQGQFDRVLLRPLNSLGQVLFESFNLESLGSLCVSLVVISYSAHELGIQFTLLDIGWFFLSGFAGATIVGCVFIILASLSFHFEDRIGIAAPVYSLTTFARYPLPIFGSIIQFILKWIVPFAFAAFYPATHFLRREGFEFFCYFSPVMAVIMVIIASLFWRFGVSRYSSTGS